VAESYIKTMQAELSALKSNVKLQAWANIITQLFNKHEQDQIVELLQNKSNKVRFEMSICVEQPKPEEGK